jgi:hypothetical protein
VNLLFRKLQYKHDMSIVLLKKSHNIDRKCHKNHNFTSKNQMEALRTFFFCIWSFFFRFVSFCFRKLFISFGFSVSVRKKNNVSFRFGIRIFFSVFSFRPFSRGVPYFFFFFVKRILFSFQIRFFEYRFLYFRFSFSKIFFVSFRFWKIPFIPFRFVF